jgi:carbonic anhydrase/acetyltransferase-like protein (isoleucine patch superfamily)
VPLYALGDLEPDIHPDAYVHPDAVVIGAVSLGAHTSVWPGAVLRGDDGRIVVGARTSIQDGTVVHTTHVRDTLIGNEATVGHNVHIEAATIGDRCLISSGSVVLNGSDIDEGAVVAAGAVVSPGSHLPAWSMALGVPARVREGYQVPKDRWKYAVDHYVQWAARFRVELRRLDQR